MNEIPRVPKARPTTQVADGVPRLRWTFAEFERLAELGFFTEDDRIELIGGELVPMAPKGNRHESRDAPLSTIGCGEICRPNSTTTRSRVGTQMRPTISSPIFCRIGRV